jgi:hypothetical protein
MDKVPAYYNDSPAAREMTVEEAWRAVAEAAQALAAVCSEYAKKATEFIDCRQRLSSATEHLSERLSGLAAARERQGA